MRRRSLIQALMAALPLTAVIARRASADDARPCSCHPSEAFHPCPGKHAWHDCAAASAHCPECGSWALAQRIADRNRDVFTCDTCGAQVTAMQLVEAGDFRRYTGYDPLELIDRKS